MKIEINKGAGFDPNIEMIVYLNTDDILSFAKILKKTIQNEPLNDKEKEFFIPLTEKLKL